MQFHIEQAVVTEKQIIETGVPGLHEFLIGRAFGGVLKHLKGGKPYVIQIEPHDPKKKPPTAEVPEGLYDIEVLIRYWHAEPLNAAVGEYVYPTVLRPDRKGENEQPFEASVQDRRFEPDGGAWKRVS